MESAKLPHLLVGVFWVRVTPSEGTKISMLDPLGILDVVVDEFVVSVCASVDPAVPHAADAKIAQPRVAARRKRRICGTSIR
jgi:Na+(H+)/acetate symporter ActP